MTKTLFLVAFTFIHCDFWEMNEKILILKNAGLHSVISLNLWRLWSIHGGKEKGNNGCYLNATLSRLLVYKSRMEYITLSVPFHGFQVLWLK